MQFKNIFVVYDPTRSEQPALNRAMVIGRDESTRVHVFACIYEEPAKDVDKAAKIKELLAAQKSKVLSAVAPLLEQGCQVTTEVEWDEDWYNAVVRASLRNSADLVLKSTYRHSTRQRFLNRTSDWTLIRECLCPVLLVKEGQPRTERKILAAIDLRGEKPSYEKLNQQLIDFSQRVMEAGNSEMHFINAFSELQEFPDRNALVNSCGVASDRIHIQMGKPEDVIVNSANEIDASLVVVGNSARSGLSAVINSNTVEKVLDRLECDVLSLP